MSPSPEELFARYRATSDPRALGAVYDRLAPELLHVALHLTGRPAEAEDLLQATFLGAIEGAERWDAGRPLTPWLMGILANQAKRARRRAAQRPDPERVQPSPPSDPAEAAEGIELDERVWAEVARLPDPFHTVLVLRLRHGLSVAEIAAALRRPPGTVRSQLQRGLERLRRALPAAWAGGALASLALPSRGLAEVRRAVLASAPPAPVPLASATLLTSAAATLGGVLAMKKAALALVACVALWAVWQLAPGTAPTGAPGRARPAALAARPALEVPPAPEARAPAPEPLAVLEPEERKRLPAVAAPEEPAEPEAARGGTLVVRARWAGDDTPAAGELVLLRRFASDATPPPVRTGRTDDGGAARFEGLEPGSVYVQLLRGGEESTWVFEGRTRTLTLAIPHGITVEGRVVDAGGSGVPEAEIWLSERWRWDRAYPMAVADRDGFFRLRAVRPDHYVGARKCGYAPGPVQAVKGVPGDRWRRDLVLERGGVDVSGRVVAAEGAPIAGAEVMIGSDRWTETVRLADGSSQPRRPPFHLTTDPEGTFRACGVPAARTAVSVRARGFAPLRSEWDVGTSSSVVLALEPEAVVRGAVRGADGAPVAAAEVRYAAEEEFLGRRTPSGRDGTFTMRGLPGGRVRLSAQHARGGRAETELELAPGAEREWNPVLGLEGQIHGVLVDHRGAPLADWRLSAFESDDRSVWTHAMTAADGRFALHGLEAVPHFVTVHAPGTSGHFPRHTLRDVEPRAEPLEVRVPDPARSLGEVVGTVVDSGGAPVGGALVTVWHETERLWRSFTTAADTGRFEIPGVPAGPCAFEVRPHDRPWKELGTHRVPAGDVLDLGRVELPPSGRVVGRIRGADEAHLEGLVMVFLGPDREGAVVERDGRSYRTGPVEPGLYTLVVRGDFVLRRRYDVRVEAGAEVVFDVDLAPAGLRRARFEPPAGTQLPQSVQVRVYDSGGAEAWSGRVHRTRTGAGEGSAAEVLAGAISVLPGEYRLEAETDGGLTAETRFAVHGYGGDDPELTVRLVRPAGAAAGDG